MVVVSTPGASNANSYQEVTDVSAILAGRGTITDKWDAVDDKESMVIRATIVLNAMIAPYRYFDKENKWYVRRATWTGQAATSTQSLPWPRIGMYNANGFDILPDVIPTELKLAHAELCGALAVKDSTLDNSTAVKGITDLTAGPVKISYNKFASTTKILPDFVSMLLVPSWLTDEEVEPLYGFPSIVSM